MTAHDSTSRFVTRYTLPNTGCILVNQRAALPAVICLTLMLVLSLNFVAMAIGQSQIVTQSDMVVIGYSEANFRITADYLGYDGTFSTYHYRIERINGRALSFFQIGFCDGIDDEDVVVTANQGFKTGYEAIELLYHDKTGINGLKAEAIDDLEPQVFDLTFNLKGYWPPTQNAVAIHAGGGQTYPSGTILGPGCPDQGCSVRGSQIGQLNWQIARPGIYATKAMRLRFTGHGQALLRFEGFTDLVRLGTGEGPDIPVSYGIGATLDEVETSGWRRATTQSDVVGINETEYLVTLTGQEQVIYIWSKLDVEPDRRSGFYTGYGRVMVELRCGIEQ